MGVDHVGKNPCDRGRMGNKVSVLCDDNKVPLSILVFPANMADQKTVIPLFENLEVNLMNNNKTKLIVIADKGYTANAEMQEALAPFNAKLLVALGPSAKCGLWPQPKAHCPSGNFKT